MSSGFATPSLNWEVPDLPNAFRSFRQYCNLIFEGPYSAKSEREKVTFLLLWIVRHGIDLYNSWTWNSLEDKHKLDAVWKKFSDHIEPKVNAYLARFQLSQLKQHSDEASGRLHRPLSGGCSKVQVRRHCGNEYQAHRAANHWDAARLRPWKTFGEGIRSCQSGRGNGHCQNFRDDEGGNRWRHRKCHPEHGTPSEPICSRSMESTS